MEHLDALRPRSNGVVVPRCVPRCPAPEWILALLITAFVPVSVSPDPKYCSYFVHQPLVSVPKPMVHHIEEAVLMDVKLEVDDSTKRRITL